jgi:hypothetical protein
MNIILKFGCNIGIICSKTAADILEMTLKNLKFVFEKHNII